MYKCKQAAAIPKNHAGWPAQPRDNPASAARLDPSYGAFIQGGAWRPGQEQPNSRISKAFGGYLWVLVASTSSSCSVSCPPTLSNREKAKPRVHHQHRPELAVLQQHHGHGSSDQFLPLTNLMSTLTHSCLSRGGKTGFCCSGSQVAPALERKRIQGSNRAGEPGQS